LIAVRLARLAEQNTKARFILGGDL